MKRPIRMSLLFTALAAAVFLLAGCAPHYVVEQDGQHTPEQAKADAIACAYDAQKAISTTSGMNPLIAKSQQRPLIAQCLQAKGYKVRQATGEEADLIKNAQGKH